MDTRFISLKPEFHSERDEQRKLQFSIETSQEVGPRYYDALQQDAVKVIQLSENANKFNFKNSGEILTGSYFYVGLDGFEMLCANGCYHSDLSNGEDVAAAGVACFEDGKLTSISNESGHYKPTSAEMLPFLRHIFEAAGNPELVFEDHSRVLKTGRKYFYKASAVISNEGIENLDYLRSEAADRDDKVIEYNPEHPDCHIIIERHASRSLGVSCKQQKQKASENALPKETYLDVSTDDVPASLTISGDEDHDPLIPLALQDIAAKEQQEVDAKPSRPIVTFTGPFTFYRSASSSRSEKEDGPKIESKKEGVSVVQFGKSS